MCTDIVMDVKIDRLTFPPSEQAVLRDIDFTVNAGDFIAVVGEPAGGKSILLHGITGAAVKFYNGVLDGKVCVFERDMAEVPLPEVCDFLGFMFQEPQNQIVSISVAEEVGFGIANRGCSRQEIRERTAEALSYVGLTGLEDRATYSLSGGQAQRLVLASILAMKTPILLLDQPGAELDFAGKRELYQHIRRLNREQGITVMMVMDNGIDLTSYANRVFEMKEGRLTEHSPSSYTPHWQYPERIPPEICRDEKIVAVEDVSFSYKGNNVGCSSINAAIYRGEFISLMGKNGSGKTTLIKLIEGLLLPDSGEISVLGHKMTKKTAAEIRRNIGFLFQNPDFQIFSSSVYEEVAFGLRGSSLSEEEKNHRVEEILEMVGLKVLKDIHPQTLSRSQRQKLAFASALVHRPRLLIADEPTAGLSETDSIALMDLLGDFALNGGTVLLVTHDPVLAKIYSDRILVLADHHLVGDYKRERFSEITEEMLLGGGNEE